MHWTGVPDAWRCCPLALLHLHLSTPASSLSFVGLTAISMNCWLTGRRCQVRPASLLRKRPASLAAYTKPVVVDEAAMAMTDLPLKPFAASAQVFPHHCCGGH